MSSKNYLVLVYRSDAAPVVITPLKEDYFSKKEAQRTATAYVRNEGAAKAQVVEFVLDVR